jgi:hypothetical protein
MLKRSLVAARRIATILVLAFSVAAMGAAPVAPARAALSGAGELRYFMEASKVYGTALICVGDTVPINVKIVRAQVSQGNALSTERVTGAKVTSVVADASIGALDRATNYTGWRGDAIGTATFTFLAHKAGSTTIRFEGHIHYRKGILEHFSFAQRNDLVSDIVAVTVQDCDYQVSVASHWKETSRRDVASISAALLTSDAPGHYQGSGTVNWTFAEAQAVNGCPLHAVSSTSQADLTARLDTINQLLVVVITYPPSPLVWYTYRSDDCTRGSEIDSVAMAAKLNFSVGTYGGTGPLPQDLTVPGYGIAHGAASVSVVRVAKP